MWKTVTTFIEADIEIPGLSNSGLQLPGCKAVWSFVSELPFVSRFCSLLGQTVILLPCQTLEGKNRFALVLPRVKLGSGGSEMPPVVPDGLPLSRCKWGTRVIPLCSSFSSRGNPNASWGSERCCAHVWQLWNELWNPFTARLTNSDICIWISKWAVRWSSKAALQTINLIGEEDDKGNSDMVASFLSPASFTCFPCMWLRGMN